MTLYIKAKVMKINDLFHSQSDFKHKKGSLYKKMLEKNHPYIEANS